MDLLSMSKAKVIVSFASDQIKSALLTGEGFDIHIFQPTDFKPEEGVVSFEIPMLLAMSNSPKFQTLIRAVINQCFVADRGSRGKIVRFNNYQELTHTSNLHCRFDMDVEVVAGVTMSKSVEFLQLFDNEVVVKEER